MIFEKVVGVGSVEGCGEDDRHFEHTRIGNFKLLDKQLT